MASPRCRCLGGIGFVVMIGSGLLGGPARCAALSRVLIAAEIFDGDGDSVDEVFLGHIPGTVEMDANQDGLITAADVLGGDDFLSPPPPTLTRTPSAVPSATPVSPATPTASATASGTATPSPTVTTSPTTIPTASATVSGTATITPTPIQQGVLFSGTIAELVPHHVGDRYVYEIVGPGAAMLTEISEVISLESDGSFVVEVQDDGHRTDLYRDTGATLVYQGSTNLIANVRTLCTPPLLRLTMPVVAGDKASTVAQCETRTIEGNRFLGRVPRIDVITPTARVASMTVPAGTFSPIIHISGTTSLGNEAHEFYLAPGIGVVREVATARGQTKTRSLVSARIDGVMIGP